MKIIWNLKERDPDIALLKRKKTLSPGIYIIPGIGLVNMVTFSNMEARSFYDRIIESKNSNNHKNAILELTKAVFKHAEVFFSLKINSINRSEKFKVIKNNINAIYAIDDVKTLFPFENMFRMRKSRSDFSLDEFVFKRKEDNLPFADNTINHRNRGHCKLSGLRKIRIHDFRHSFASMNYDLGADMKTISEQMGYSNLTNIQNVYTSMFQKKNDERIALVNKARKKKK